MSQEKLYCLVVGGSRTYKEINCSDLPALACAISQWWPNNCSNYAVIENGFLLLVADFAELQKGNSCSWLHIRAFSVNGHLMHLPSLLGLAFNLGKIDRRAGRYWNLRFGAWNGVGPVPGTACSRGGGGSFRNIKTYGEIRLNALVVDEDGEVQARSRRRNLPTAWEDFQRRSAKSWKEQRKGRKAWQR